jgi:methylmalonyl-CoA mutase cobalamin-binding subunit
VVLFDTAVGSGNLGDLIVMQGVERGLAPVLEQSCVLRFATHLQNLTWRQSVYGSKRRFADAADLKFIGGTACLVPHALTWAPWWQLGPPNLRLYRGSILVGAGRVGGRPDPYTAWLYRSALTSGVAHSVRDERTRELLESLGFRALVTGCPSLWGVSDRVCAAIPQGKADRVVVSLSSHRKQRDVAADRALADLAKRNYAEVIFWCQGTVGDDAYWTSLAGPGGQRIYSLPALSQVLSEGGVDYIGTRLHGAAYALQHAVRSIALDIDGRALGLQATHGVPCVRRGDVAALETLVNSQFPTSIRLPSAAIAEFLRQFAD